MPTRPQLSDEEILKDLHFPAGGLNLLQGFNTQPNVPSYNGSYVRTTPLGMNVRGFEAQTGRFRGGSRLGLVRYIDEQPGDTLWVTQCLQTIVTDNSAGADVVQLNQSGRVIYLIAVSQGNVYYATPGDTSWTLAANNTGEDPPLNFSGIMYSAANNQKLYFADGINYAYFDPSTQTVQPWMSTQGSLPIDSQNNTPRLICTWRGRTVVSGLIFDPQNWFMSAVGDPTNWNYFTVEVNPAQAVAGNNSPLGFIGDVVTALIPYNDDVMFFGGDHTIYMMNGDPMAGGQIDLVSDIIGMAWGTPWCKDPYGNLYFVSNRTGIYTMIPGQAPQRISQAIEQLLATIDTGLNAINLVWDDRFQGVHVFVTLLSAPAVCTHLFYEQRSGAWWTDQFGDTNLNPLCCCIFDGNTPEDRVSLIGSWDGYVRAISPTATDDDGTAIDSEVLIGPLLTPNFDELILKDLQAIMGQSSDTVTYNIYAGLTPEKALLNAPIFTGTLTAGRGPTFANRRASHAFYIGISASSPWSMEAIRVRIAGLGKVRRRSPK